MSFVVSSGSKQFVTDFGQKITVDKLTSKEGDIIELPVLFSFGSLTEQKSVQAKVVGHQKGKKIRVVKYKSKSNYHKQSGFRASETILELVK